MKRIIFILLVCTFGFVVNETCPLRDNPAGGVALWHFDADVANPIDIIGGHNLSPKAVNEPYWISTGCFSGAYRFVGNNTDGTYLTYASDASWAFGTGGFTVMCWVRHYAEQDSWYFGTAHNTGNFSVYPFIFITQPLPTVGQELRVYIVGGGGDLMVPFDIDSYLNVWVHLVATRLNGYIYIYINAQVAGSAANSDNVAQDILTIGGNGSGGNGFYGDMDMDDVAVFSVGLSSGAIQQIYYQQIGRHR